MPPLRKSLATTLKTAGIKPKATKRKEPLWKGPQVDGITYSTLCRFLACRERFRLMMMMGLKPVERFNSRIEYGQMWHTCEEALAAKRDWKTALVNYCQQVAKKYRDQQTEVDKWYNVCKVQFPIYIDYWRNQHDVKNRTPMYQEYTFKVPYTLPSGRVVLLRGKWDSVDAIGAARSRGIYVQENKSKSEIDGLMIERQLTFDLQTMIYLVAFKAMQAGIPERVRKGTPLESPLMGVRYNVIRRPLSGGKGTIVQHKATKNKLAETKVDYFNRLSGIIADSPQDFFARWKVDITPGEIEKFERECLQPVLEQLCDWYEHVEAAGSDVKRLYGAYDMGNGTYSFLHWRHPFGVYNVLDEGGASDLDNYLSTGSTVGLQVVDKLFTELD